MTKAILFDLGNTIIKNINIDLRKGFLDLIPELKNNNKYLKYVDELLIKINGRTNIEYPIFDIFKEIELLFNIHFNKDYYEIEYDFYKKACQDELMDNVIEVLSFLKNKGLIIGIVSNSLIHQEILMRRLNEFGILKYFNFVLSSQNTIYRKGDARIFAIAYEKILKINNNIKKDEVLFIGDNLLLDYEASINYGFKSIWFNRTNQETDVLSFNNMEKLNKYLEGII